MIFFQCLPFVFYWSWTYQPKVLLRHVSFQKNPIHGLNRDSWALQFILKEILDDSRCNFQAIVFPSFAKSMSITHIELELKDEQLIYSDRIRYSNVGQQKDQILWIMVSMRHWFSKNELLNVCHRIHCSFTVSSFKRYLFWYCHKFPIQMNIWHGIGTDLLSPLSQEL